MAYQKEQKDSEVTNLDDRDYEILGLLERNAKLTVREFAAQINLTPTPTHERIKNLEKSGVIKTYAAILDKKKINRGIMVLCMVTLKGHDKKKNEAFIHAVLSFTEVTECYIVSGDSDFMLKIVTQSMDSYQDFFMNKLTSIDVIWQTKSIFVMDVIKETHQLL
jgi:Lrp/AsnC family leucine-responsive transcriptional regulator